MSDDTPLLDRRHRSASAAVSMLSWASWASVDSKSNVSFYDRHNLPKTRFWWFCSLGFVAIVILHLSFLPRTSLSRDLRRWHGMKLTKTDIKRNYLVYSGIGRISPTPEDPQHTNEDWIQDWLTEFSAINSEHPVNILASDNLKLTSLVENKFRSFGLKTELYSHHINTLDTPVSLSLQLVDDGEVVYSAQLAEEKTPAFNAFGLNGSVLAPFVFVNEATNDDFLKLRQNGIVLDGKIFIAHHSDNVSVSEQLQTCEFYGASGFVSYNDFSAQSKLQQAEVDRSISRSSVAAHVFTAPDLQNLARGKIPSVPVSIRSLQPILNTLGKPIAKDFAKWPYNPTGNDMKLNMSTIFSAGRKRKLVNIVGSYKGVMSDGEVIIGASRDSFTSKNPLSGHVVMMEILRHFNRLVKLGWKPLRTIKFVSWDGSRAGLIGSQLSANDSELFSSRQPILGYINLDADVVTGSRLLVDSSPMFNHLLKKNARFIPIPKNSSLLKSVTDFEPENEYPDDMSTLYRLWSSQDNLTINNVLGYQIKHSDAVVLLSGLGAPVINVKFEHNPKKDLSVYVPNSNYYSYDWLVKHDVDENLLLHGLLVRYLGLLLITLSDHEVADYKAKAYFEKIGDFWSLFAETNADVLTNWAAKNVSEDLVSKHSIYTDLDLEKMTFSALVDKLHELIDTLGDQSRVFDEYIDSVKMQLIEDYPWYKMLKKVHIYAKYKVANYKLLHLEKEFQLKAKDLQYLFGEKEPPQSRLMNHVIYGIPEFSVKEPLSFDLIKRDSDSVFTHLQKAMETGDFTNSVRWLVLTYERLKSVLKKID